MRCNRNGACAGPAAAAGVAGRQAAPGAAGAAADGGAVREGQPITRAALQRSCCAVRGDCARGHGGACGAAEHSGLGFFQGAWKMPIFPCFCMFFWAVSRFIKNDEEGHRASFLAVFAQLQKRCHASSKMMKRDTGPLFSFFGRTQKRNDEEGHRASFLVFWAHSKAVSRFIKNDEEGHRASFLVFWARSKAVSRFIKNDEEGHRAFFLPFLLTSKAVSRFIKNDEEGHWASFLVFWAHSKAVSRFIKNDEEGHRASFLAVFAQLQKRCHAASKMKHTGR